MPIHDVTTVKALMEYLAAYGVPGGVVLALWIFLKANGGKPRDPASEVLAALQEIRSDLKEVRDGVDEMDTRLTRVETRQEMLIGGEVQHWTGRKIPPR